MTFRGGHLNFELKEWGTINLLVCLHVVAVDVQLEIKRPTLHFPRLFPTTISLDLLLVGITMMTGLCSGSPSKMIVLAPLLLILLVASTPRHVHASPRGKVAERRHHRQLRQEGNGRQLMANAPDPEGKMGMGMSKGVSNVFKMNKGVGKVEKSRSPGNIFDNGEAAEAKGKGMMMSSSSRSSGVSSSSPDTTGKGKGKGKGKVQYVQRIEKKSKSTSKGMTIHKLSLTTVATNVQEAERNPVEEESSTETLDQSTVQVPVENYIQAEAFEDDESGSWLGLPEVTTTVAQSSIALPITKQQVTDGTLVCTLDPDTGFFGEATSDLVIVPYLFQATLVSGTPLTIINRRIAPNLDHGMVEGILPYFFPCAGRRRLQASRAITGISAMGDDIPLVGGRKYII
jgi:hypothetical protein